MAKYSTVNEVGLPIRSPEDDDELFQRYQPRGCPLQRLITRLITNWAGQGVGRIGPVMVHFSAMVTYYKNDNFDLFKSCNFTLKVCYFHVNCVVARHC